MARKKYVIGNWKMYKTSKEATDYILQLLPQIQETDSAYLAVPFTSIAPATVLSNGTSLVIGAQNMNDAREGAFTGEIAGLMLKEAGASFVLLGHSERRHVFGETNEWIARKVRRALQDDLQPVLCVGETGQERKNGQTEEVVFEQIATALKDLSVEDVSRVILAYEPVWAIGTGEVATEEIIEKMHRFCRGVLTDLFSKALSATVPILYGGSVKLDNIGRITAQKDVDGVLVGGASLDPDTFAQLIQTCTR